MQNIVSILKMMISSKQSDILTTDPINNKEKENNQLEKYETTSESIKGTMDLNNELMSNDGLNIDDNIDLSPHKTSQPIIINIENNASDTSIQSKISYESTIDKINNIIIEKLIKVIIKKHDKDSIDFNQIQQLNSSVNKYWN